ncbi:unnamed protein product, partial [Rotaria magnacalcarata]
MSYYILFFELLISSVIIADPGLAPIDPNAYAVPSSSSYDYYGYRQAQAKQQQQLETPSPYLNKRNPDVNQYPNSQQSVISPYGTNPTRVSPNQCRLHINCPNARNRVALDIQGPA